jgi:hypothetical protein
MTVKITYTDGTTETYYGVTSFTNNGSVVEFKGKKSPTGTVELFQINWASIRKIEMSA